MNAVIGLVERRDDLDRALSGLQAAGFGQEMIGVSDKSPTLWEQVNNSFQPSVRRAASIGAGLTGGAYAAIGVSAARCAINGGFPTSWGVEHGDDPQGHGHGQHSQDKHSRMMANLADCQVLLGGGMGMGAYESLQRIGITPVLTDVSDIGAAVQAFLDGALEDQKERLH